MNLRKTAALLLSLIMCFSLILPVGSFAEGTVTAADNAKRSENLLGFCRQTAQHDRKVFR